MVLVLNGGALCNGGGGIAVVRNRGEWETVTIKFGSGSACFGNASPVINQALDC